MADFTIDKEIAGKPAYVWIAGGVVVVYGAYWLMNRGKNTQGTAPQYSTPYATGSSGGEGLATVDGYTPAGIGITAPTPLPPGTVITLPGGPAPTPPPTTPLPPVTKVPVKVPKVNRAPAPGTVSGNRGQVTTTHKRGYTQAQLEAAKLRKAQQQIKTTPPPPVPVPPAQRPPRGPIRTIMA